MLLDCELGSSGLTNCKLIYLRIYRIFEVFALDWKPEHTPQPIMSHLAQYHVTIEPGVEQYYMPLMVTWYTFNWIRAYVFGIGLKTQSADLLTRVKIWSVHRLLPWIRISHPIPLTGPQFNLASRLFHQLCLGRLFKGGSDSGSDIYSSRRSTASRST